MSTLAWLQSMARIAQPISPQPTDSTDSGRPAAMGGLDPITAAPDKGVVYAALAHIRDSGACRESRLLWGLCAYRSAHQLFGDLHPVVLAVSRVFQRVLAEQQLTFNALLVAEERLGAALRARDQVQTLISRCAYATALHRDGDCVRAEEQVDLCLQTWWASPHGFGHSATVLLSAAAIRAGCGRTGAAVDVLVRDAAYLAHLDGRSRRLAARWLALVATTHHRWCGQTSPASAPGGDELQHEVFWLSVLENPHRHDRRTTGHQLGRIA